MDVRNPRSLDFRCGQFPALAHAGSRHDVYPRPKHRPRPPGRGSVRSRIGSGLLIHTLLAAFGLSAILAASVWAFAAVKTAGAVYLIYLGLQAVRKKVGRLDAPGFSPIGSWRLYRQGVVSNTLNPKVAIFFLAFLPQFVDPGPGHGPMPFLFLGAIFVVGGTLWSIGQAMCAASATRTIRRNPALLGWLERLSGCVYIALGLNLLRSKPQPA